MLRQSHTPSELVNDLFLQCSSRFRLAMHNEDSPRGLLEIAQPAQDFRVILREPKQDFTSAEVVSTMPHLSARYIETLPEVTSYLLANLQAGDVVLVLSAGDADQVSTDVITGLQER